jgi:hypothetical protein
MKELMWLCRTTDAAGVANAGTFRLRVRAKAVLGMCACCHLHSSAIDTFVVLHWSDWGLTFPEP